jgi:hypothetical protein
MCWESLLLCKLLPANIEHTRAYFEQCREFLLCLAARGDQAMDVHAKVASERNSKMLWAKTLTGALTHVGETKPVLIGRLDHIPNEDYYPLMACFPSTARWGSLVAKVAQKLVLPKLGFNLVFHPGDTVMTDDGTNGSGRPIQASWCSLCHMLQCCCAKAG